MTTSLEQAMMEKEVQDNNVALELAMFVIQALKEVGPDSKTNTIALGYAYVLMCTTQGMTLDEVCAAVRATAENAKVLSGRHED